MSEAEFTAVAGNGSQRADLQSDRDDEAAKLRQFIEKIDFRGPGDCWLWTGTLTQGYGRIWLDRPPRIRPAHREVYEALVGSIPNGLQIDHLCRRRNCVNPAHMEPVTNAENTRRGDCTKLNWEKVRVIRESRLTNAELARQFGVSNSTIYLIRKGKRWC